MPKISVIIPVYNAELFLDKAMGSIVNQTFQDVEIICVDDCSTDSSYSILQNFAEKDSRIVVLKNEQNLGIVGALNRGLDVAKGEFIARMDNDDIAELNRFQVQVDFLEKNPQIGLCGTFIKKFGQVNRLVKLPVAPDEIKANLCFNCCIMHPTVMMRSDLLKKYNLRYDTQFNNSEDFDLWTRCSEFFEIANIPLPLLNYRVHAMSISSAKKEEQRSKAIKIVKRQLEKYFASDFDEKDLLLLFDEDGLDETALESLMALYKKLLSLGKSQSQVSPKWFEFYLKKTVFKVLRAKFKKTRKVLYLSQILQVSPLKGVLLAVLNFYRLKF